jgi:acyl-CoA reductase-like NAD-dependent aldehyde dehydrogenase
MIGRMATRKTSVSLTDEAIAAATKAAGVAGVSMSSWLSNAAIEHAWREEALAAADELYDTAVRESGPETVDDRRWVSEVLAATVGRVQSVESAAA